VSNDLTQPKQEIRDMTRTARNTTLTIATLAALFIGCGEATVVDNTTATNAAGDGGKQDSGWLGADSYEVGAVVVGVVRQALTGDWADLETDEELQLKLVDLQIKFIKTTAESHGWRFNQLADSVDVTRTSVEDGSLVMEYTAVVDLLGRFNGTLPSLDRIDPRVFTAKVPVAPTDVSFNQMRECSEVDGGHSVADYNFHYYFAPDKEGCDLETGEAVIEINHVFERPISYPEYDKLMQDLGDGKVGFYAALVPNRGDNDPLSRFKAHTDMLERDLGLTGTDSDDGTYRRFIWEKEGATIIIDVYDPTEVPWESSFAASFRERLSEYTLVHYNGHSSYGSKHLLDDPDAFTSDYQIITIHSCQSYAYYTRQVFRAKATENDPSGFAGADIMATGKSSYPAGAPPTLGVLLEALMDGMNAITRGTPEDAPDWLTIAADMKNSTWGDILYGIAGVRTNAWHPSL